MKLVPSGLLKLLRIPDLGHSPEVNAIVKLMLSCVHDGYLWLEGKIDLNIDVIHRITDLSKVDDDPGTHFVGKKLDRNLATKLTRELKLTKGTRVYDSMDIEDHTLRFTVQLLIGQVLRKCIPNEVPEGAIDLATQVKEGEQYNWCLYLLNQFMDDYKATQESNQLLHYSWLLILMAFLTWKEPSHTGFFIVRGKCSGVRYVNLWVNPDPDRHRINNQVFFTYHQQLCAVVTSKPRITKDLTNMYRKKIRFMADLHHVYIKPCGVKTKYWYTSSYRMVQENIEEIIKEWPKEWINPNINLSESYEESDKEKGKRKAIVGKDK